MGPPHLRAQFVDFFRELEPLLQKNRNKTALTRLCRSECYRFDTNGGLERTSLKKYMTHYRNALRELGVDNEVVWANLGLTQHQHKVLKRQYARTLSQEHTNLRPLDAGKAIGIATGLLDSNKVWDVAVGIMLLTGRRGIEIFQKGSFSKVQGNPYALEFTGQAKTREDEGRGLDTYQIPVLIEARNILLCMKEIRAYVRDQWGRRPLNNEQFSQRTNAPLSGAVKNAFGLDWKVKDLRSAYAAICHATYCPENVSVVAYYSKILGHKAQGKDATDLVTPLSYFDFQVVGAANRATEMNQIADAAFDDLKQPKPKYLARTRKL